MSTSNPTSRAVDLIFYEETGITRSQFTDGGSTTGTYQLQFELPAGFYIHRTHVYDVIGFAADTSATLQVGDGSDADRYNAGTPSVFTTISRLDMGVPSGTLFLATANRPTLTITSAADFTNVTPGTLSIRIYGWIV